MFESLRPLRVFLCHASEDKPAVRELYRRLKASGVEPWVDEEDLIAGQDWEYQIRKAVRDADIVLVCLTQHAASKKGFVQREIRLALDVAEEQPEGTIYVIPVKLEECTVPDRLSRWHWVNFFDEQGYERLMRALQAQGDALGLGIAETQQQSASEFPRSKSALADEITTAETSLARKALFERAASISDRRNFEAARTSWLNSEKGKNEATQEFRRFVAEFKRLADEVSNGVSDFEFIHENSGDDSHAFYCLGISLVMTWNSGRFANNLEGSRLYVNMFEGRMSFRYAVSEQPTEITVVRYDVDLHQLAGIVWRETGGDRREFPDSSRLAEMWMDRMLFEIERHSRNVNL